jgi:uncharacterized protein YPO0396
MLAVLPPMAQEKQGSHSCFQWDSRESLKPTRRTAHLSGTQKNWLYRPKGDTQMEQTTVDTTQLKAKIDQLRAEKKEAHDAVARIEYQLDTKGRTFRLFSATEEERGWYGKTKYALRKHKQMANDLQVQIGKLNEELKRAAHLEYEARREKCFIVIAKRKLPPAVFEAILNETIQQVGAL